MSCDSCVLCIPLTHQGELPQTCGLLFFVLDKIESTCTSCVSMLDDIHGVAVVGHALGEMQICFQLECFIWLAQGPLAMLTIGMYRRPHYLLLQGS